MTRNLMTATVLAVVAALPAVAQTPLGNEITYQARIQQSGVPLNDTADLEFRLFNALTGGVQVGSTQSISNLTVIDGDINVQLNFGTGAFNGDKRFLEISLRSPAGGGAFTTLTPRQPLTAVPYALYALSGPGSGGPWAVSGNNIFNTNTGNVGIGTSAPAVSLQIAKTDPVLVLQDTDSPSVQSGYVGFWSNAAVETGWLGFGTPGSPDFGIQNKRTGGDIYMLPGPGGNVGIGTTAPTARLDVRGGPMLVENLGDQADLLWLASERSWVFRQQDTGAVTALKLQSIGGGGNKNFVIQTDGFVGIGTLSPQAKLDVNGTTRTKVLEITGADLAEKFPASETLEPGMVVAIDPANPGKLCLARGAYNRCVAGVVSGANNFAAGAVLGNLPGHEDAPAVALSGRVYVWCDAAADAIEPGDPLTTSDTPGHAMKATDAARMNCTLLGKAMTALPRGERGLVLVLVNLQ